MDGNAATFFLRFNTAENQKRRITAQIFRAYPSTASPWICQSDNKKVPSAGVAMLMKKITLVQEAPFRSPLQNT